MTTVNKFVGRVIQENGDRVHELWHMRGYYVLRLHVREFGELRHMKHCDRILTDRQAGEWTEMLQRGVGYVPGIEGAA